MRARPLGSNDHGAVRAIFGSTLLLGRELPFSLPDLDRYESLCLDWYLGPGREDAAVVEAHNGRVVGYALVCTDEQAHTRWMRRRAARFAVQRRTRRQIAARALVGVRALCRRLRRSGTLFAERIAHADGIFVVVRGVDVARTVLQHVGVGLDDRVEPPERIDAIAGLDNALENGAMQDHFASDPVGAAARPYLSIEQFSIR